MTVKFKYLIKSPSMLDLRQQMSEIIQIINNNNIIMTEKYKISSNKEDTARRLLSHNKERNNAICIIGPRDYHTK